MSANHYIQQTGIGHRFSIYLICLSAFLCLAVLANVLVRSVLGVGILSFRESYVIPSVVFCAFVMAIPCLYLLAKGNFDFFHPLVYPVWIYLFPAFVLGSLYFATGLYGPRTLSFIEHRESSIPLAEIYVGVGFACLSLGFLFPQGRRLGKALAKRLPAWNWDLDRLIFPAMALLVFGQAAQLMAFSAGTVGFQFAEEPSAVGHIYYSFSYLSSLASLLSWMAVFRAPKFKIRHYVAVCILLPLIPYSMLIAGSKGELLRNAAAIFFAYTCSGRRLRIRHGVIAGILLVVAVLAGTVYGTLFRQVKGDESRIGVGENVEIGISTINAIREMNIGENVAFAVERAFERFETMTSLAVIVENRERLKQAESEHGIANNIWTDTWTAIIPRIFWPDKPIISNTRALAALYFEDPTSSYAITPVGDLLRNFGPLGIPLGMAVLGLALRVLHSGLYDGHQMYPWRLACYYLLLINVSFESYYGNILPSLIRIAVVLTLGTLLLNSVLRLGRFSTQPDLPTDALSHHS